MPPSEPRHPGVRYVEVFCRGALNRVRGMGFAWSLNPYVGCQHRCAFCYVRGFELRADRPADERYGRTVRVKINVAAVLAHELSRRSWRDEGVAVGTATDPYQPAEGRYRLTRHCLEVLSRHASFVDLITRGPLVVRDVDVLKDLDRGPGASVTFSVPTLDDEVWRRTEPGTAHPRQRLRALARLAAAGVETGVAMAPILPGLSDGPESLEAVVRASREAGARYLWASVVNLREGTREHFLGVLSRHWPELLPGYLEIFSDRGYAPARLSQEVASRVSRLRGMHAVPGARRARPQP
ncbi:MAG: radical SAM protein, partial [Candidatus Dormibacterales bacterium]